MAPPLGKPKYPQEIANDAHGSYVVYIGKACKVCQVQLTSRNRYGFQMFCNTHGLQHDRLRMAVKRDSHAPSKKQPEAHHVPSPAKQRLHGLLTAFLDRPTVPITKADLLAGLVDYELVQRFRSL